MNVNQKYLIAAAVVVVVVVAAVAAVVIMNNNNGNGGNNNKYDYTITSEVIGEDGKTISTKDVKFTTTSKDNAQFIEAANKAFSSAGLNVVLVSDSTQITVKYNGGGYNSTFYKVGSTWIAVSKTLEDYSSHQTLYFALDHGYISSSVYQALPSDVQLTYSYTGMGSDWDYQKTPYYNYSVSYDKISADGKVVSGGSGTITFCTMEKTNTAYVTAINGAFKSKGIDASFSNSMYVSCDGSSNSACYYYDFNFSEWTKVENVSTDYINNARVSLELVTGYISEDVYNALSATEKAGYVYDSMGYGYDYRKTPTVDE